MTEALRIVHVSDGSEIHRLFVFDGKPGWCVLCNRFLDSEETVHVVREKSVTYVD